MGKKESSYCCVQCVWNRADPQTKGNMSNRDPFIGGLHSWATSWVGELSCFDC